MPQVDFLHGDILEGGYDLTVFPCSAKGTVSSATRKNIKDVEVPMPQKMGLGDVSETHKAGKPSAGTKNVVFGASVLNDFSSIDTITKIARRLGEITCEYSEITNVETPLLGTGAGRLRDEESAQAFKDGFMETARRDARLTVFMYGAERLEKVKAFLENPLYATDYRVSPPPSLQQALKNYRNDTKDHKTAFLIMSFEKTSAHEKIVQAIKDTCAKHGILALRADDKQYADGLLDNVLTYVYGCDFGIAVFERIRRDIYNPNVSYEAGYLMGLDKPLLFLKDETLSALPTDLVGNLYKTFDFLDPIGTLPDQIEIWLRDKGFI